MAKLCLLAIVKLYCKSVTRVQQKHTSVTLSTDWVSEFLLSLEDSRQSGKYQKQGYHERRKKRRRTERVSNAMISFWY